MVDWFSAICFGTTTASNQHYNYSITDLQVEDKRSYYRGEWYVKDKKLKENVTGKDVMSWHKLLARCHQPYCCSIWPVSHGWCCVIKTTITVRDDCTASQLDRKPQITTLQVKGIMCGIPISFSKGTLHVPILPVLSWNNVTVLRVRRRRSFFGIFKVKVTIQHDDSPV